MSGFGFWSESYGIRPFCYDLNELYSDEYENERARLSFFCMARKPFDSEGTGMEEMQSLQMPLIIGKMMQRG